MSGDHNSLAKFEFGKYSFCSSPELCSYLLQLNVETSLSYDKIKSNVMLKFLQENNCIMKKFNFINVTQYSTLHLENIEIFTHLCMTFVLDYNMYILSLICFARMDSS